MEFWLIFIVAGLVAGFMAGLLGIGGGFIIVPVLIWVFPLVGIPEKTIPHFAIGTSLLCICVTALSSTRAHHKKNAVEWPMVKLIIPGLIFGALVGAAVASFLQGTVLIILFVAGAFFTGVYLLSGHQPQPHPSERQWPFVAYGSFTGLVSTLIGIGGGSVLVPYLVYKGRPIVKAVGTAAACGFPIALFGALGYAFGGYAQNDIQYSLGYLYFPAFLGIVIFSTLSAPVGTKVAHLIPAPLLRKLFAAFLFLTGAQILYSHWF